MTPEEYRRQQSKITDRATTRVGGIVSRLLRSGRKFSPRQYHSILAGLVPTITDARDQSTTLAGQFYTTQRRSNGTTSDFDPASVSAISYTTSSMSFVMDPVRKPLLGLEQLEADEAAERVRHVTGFAGMHVEQAGRDGLVLMTKLDPVCLGWARMDPIPPSCPFCIMLLSRGPVYGDESSAVHKTGGGTYHPDDTCVAVPVFNRDTWPGKAGHAEALKIYVAASKAASGTSRSEIVAAIRLHLLTLSS